MRTIESTERLQNLWTRAIVLVLVAGILVMNLPLPAFARSLAERCDNPEFFEFCKNDSEGLVVETDSCSNHETGLHMEYSEENSPDHELSCCLDSCKYCILPCCGGVFYSFSAVTIALNMGFVSFVTHQNSIPFSINLSRIFRPPRV